MNWLGGAVITRSPKLTGLSALAHQRRRFGYRRIHNLLTSQGHAVNHRRGWRLYKLNKLCGQGTQNRRTPTSRASTASSATRA